MKFIYINASKQLSGLQPSPVLLNLNQIESIGPVTGMGLISIHTVTGKIYVVRTTLKAFTVFLHSVLNGSAFINTPEEASFRPENTVEVFGKETEVEDEA